MKTPKDFMPPMPRVRGTTHNGDVIYMSDFTEWFDKHIKPIFENGVVMYSTDYIEKTCEKYYHIGQTQEESDVCCFLAIGIQPIDQAVAKEELVKVLNGALEPHNDGKLMVKDLVERIEKWGVR